MSEETVDDTVETPKPNEKGAQDEFGMNFIFAMGEIRGELKNFRSDFKDFQVNIKSDVDTKFKDLDDRLKIIEKWHYKVTALTGAAGIILGYAAEWIIRHV